jgi:outer membrane lipoprotein-sorting protein
MRKRLWLAVGMLLVLSLTVAACGQQMTAEEIVAKMQETVENTEDGHAVVKVEANAQGIALSVTGEVWEKSPNKFRAKVLETSDPQFEGTIMVSDGQQGWFYEPGRNVVTVGQVEEMETPLPQQMLGEMQGAIEHILDASNVELAGEEEVAGRAAYKLVLTPKEDAEQVFPGGGTATLWVDKDQWFILKATYEGSTFGQGSMEVQSFELNPGLSDDLFAFEIPDGVEIIDAKAQAPIPLTLDEAKAQAGFPLLLPEYLPEGATLIEVFKNRDTIILRYNHSAEIAFALAQGPELASPPPMGASQDITVRGQSATVITDEAVGNTFLYWTEDGVTVTIAGHISLQEALQVAESLK